MRGDHYSCETLYGRDKCSPAPGTTSRGTRCETPCLLYQGWTSYYYCFTDNRKVKYETCGYHGVSQELKVRLELTDTWDSSGVAGVCADPCRWNDEEGKDYKYCNIVKWRWNHTEGEAT